MNLTDLTSESKVSQCWCIC